MGSNRLLLGLGVLRACGLTTGCVSLHNDVYRSRLPGEPGSLYTTLKDRLEGGPRATIPKDLDWILQAVGTVEKGS